MCRAVLRPKPIDVLKAKLLPMLVLLLPMLVLLLLPMLSLMKPLCKAELLVATFLLHQPLLVDPVHLHLALGHIAGLHEVQPEPPELGELLATVWEQTGLPGIKCMLWFGLRLRLGLRLMPRGPRLRLKLWLRLRLMLRLRLLGLME